MDEFGISTDQIVEEPELPDSPIRKPRPTQLTAHDETQLPVRHPHPPPSPEPFSHYAPTSEKIQVLAIGTQSRPPLDIEQGQIEEDEKGAGCCKCVVM